MSYKILNKKEENRTLELEIQIEESFIKSFREKAIKAIGNSIELKGFRKGMAPEKMIVETVGELKIFEESAIRAVESTVPTIVMDEKIDAIVQPKIHITKMAPGNDLEFKASFILMPDIKLADYKQIAKSIKEETDVKVEDKEVDDYINYIRKIRSEANQLKNKTSPDKEVREQAHEQKDLELPEFNDEFVKTLGNFKDVEEFKTQLRENMLEEKKAQTGQKRRVQIIEKIISESKVDLPEILIEEELDRMMHQFKDDITSMKMEPGDYLREIKKTEEDLRKEWRTDATKRAQMNMILPAIARAEKIEIPAEKIEHETKHLMEHHGVDEVRAKTYVEFALKNEEVFKLLESIK